MCECLQDLPNRGVKMDVGGGVCVCVCGKLSLPHLVAVCSTEDDAICNSQSKACRNSYYFGVVPIYVKIYMIGIQCKCDW